MKRLLMGIALMLAIGCAHRQENLPPVAWKTEQDALTILHDRAAAVRTVVAEGLITLQRPNGESVRLDLAMVSQPPDRLRLRAWKLSRAVFDLTLNNDALWLYTPDDPSLKEKVHSAGMNAGKLARTWAMLAGQFFQSPGLTMRERGNQLIFTGVVDGKTVRCEVDRRTLVPRRYVILDDRGVARFTLELGDYQMHGEIPFAHRYTAVSEMGRILISLRDVELNTELAAGAFIPPRRAQKLP